MRKGDRAAHPVERAAERYGVRLDPFDIAHLRDLIASGQGMLMGRQADGRERWAVKLRGVVFQAIYVPATRSIATILPANARSMKKGRA